MSDGYLRICNQVCNIVPKSSLVGMLLAHEENFRVIDSSQIGLLQHDGFSWLVSGDHFIEIRERSAQSVLAEQSIHSWLLEMPMAERRQFVDELFDLMYASGATSLSDIRKDRFRTVAASLPMMKDMSKESLSRIFQFLILFRQITHRLNIESVMDHGKTALDKTVRGKGQRPAGVDNIEPNTEQ